MSKAAVRQIHIQGTVAPGFESVKALYERNMQTLAERDTQLCVYHHGEKVVDLWASTDADANFSADSLINVFSSGKSLEALAMASLVGKGLLDYTAKVTDYWPEFGANGKVDLTVAELMRHEAGLAAFNISIKPEDLLTQNIKLNRIGSIIEGHAQKFREDGSSREYHAVTRGWIVNEVFRRIDPEGRTIGEFLRQDISLPLGVDAIIGVPEDQLGRRIKVSTLGFGFQFKESLKPKFLNRKMENNIFQTAGRLMRLVPAMRKGTGAGSPPPFEGMDRVAFFNEPAVAMGETPSANANCSARGLAKIAAMLAAGGKWQGVEYLSDAAWQALHAVPVEAHMGIAATNFTQGGVALFAAPVQYSSKLDHALNTGREGFYGWMGLGGSIFQWHPQTNIGFGYVPTSLNVLDLYNERGKTYQAEVLKCAAGLSVAG
jgi:CubicO group peptidase (beta-lactamase class C family)